MNMQKQPLLLKLHITISMLFIGLIVSLGIVLTWQSFNKLSSIVLATAHDVYRQIATEVALDFKATYQPVMNTVNLLALSPVVGAQTLDDRLQSLALFASVLRSQPDVTGVQVGYPDGDYFLVRSLADERARQHFNAPQAAAFQVDHIDRGPDRPQQRSSIFFDAQLHELARKTPEPTSYDPRLRPWYVSAPGTGRPGITDPYMFHFSGKPGITAMKMSGTNGVVVASDVTLENLSASIGRHQITDSSEVALIDESGAVYGFHEPANLVLGSDMTGLRMAQLAELDSPVLSHVQQQLLLHPGTLEFEFNDRSWIGAMRRVSHERDDKTGLYVLMVSPVDELLTDVIKIGWQSIITTVAIVLLSIPIVWLFASRISRSMRRLAVDADRIGRFDFASPEPITSHISEVRQLASAMHIMQSTINQFLGLLASLASERDFDSLQRRITQETMRISQSDAALTYLLSDDETQLLPGAVTRSQQREPDNDALPTFAMQQDSPLVRACADRHSSVIDITDANAVVLKPILELVEGDEVSLIAVPLRNRHDELIGLLCLLYAGDARLGQHRSQLAFIEALSGFAAVSLESRHLMMMQEALLDAFIKLIAGAIDEKSPYTGGHCQRVPELTRLLAQAACDSDAPPFTGFALDADDWQALDIASWLHDCGKVTTPEYVVDKATKLETIYDRIHEVRMRFEVLKRDAIIDYWQGVAGGGDREQLAHGLQAQLDQLDADFRFVAECNTGGEFMAPEQLERLGQIASRTWQRTLDDRLGISWEEHDRKARQPEQPLPVDEPLLADKPEHLVPRGERDRLAADNPWGFRMEVPEHLYNRGELYNLSVARGTLTEEERYKINEHIVQTIIMLEKLPYPKHLRSVPELAGGHHEKMDGTGYPRRLHGGDMPLAARMMAIADIFEALTASDRPYKKPKTLSEAIRIMYYMQQDQHIDADLFKLFINSGIWLEYARKYLDPEQIDDVDISEYMS